MGKYYEGLKAHQVVARSQNHASWSIPSDDRRFVTQQSHSCQRGVKWAQAHGAAPRGEKYLARISHLVVAANKRQPRPKAQRKAGLSCGAVSGEF